MNSVMKKTEVLIEALPYMQKLYGKTVVIKYGSKAMVNETLKNTVMDDIILLKNIGVNPVVVLEKSKKEIISLMHKKGGKVAGLECIDGDFTVLNMIARDEYIPVLSYHSDTAAAEIAASLQAEKLIFITDVDGVKLSEDDSAPVKVLTSEQAHKLIEEEIISEGMTTKVLACISAIDAGIRRAHIINGRIPHCILMEMFTYKGIGTMILKELVPYFEAEKI